MTIDYNLLPTIDNTMWRCENCDDSIDLSWLIEDIINECTKNKAYKDALYKSQTFNHGQCDCCNHSIWFYEKETQELKTLIKQHLN